MKLKLITLALFASCAVSYGAVIDWTGGTSGNDITVEANWGTGAAGQLPTIANGNVGHINSGDTVSLEDLAGYQIQQNDGAVSGQGTIFSGTIYDLDGGTLTISSDGGGDLRVEGGSTLTVDGGTITGIPDDFRIGDNGDSTFTMLSGSVTVGDEFVVVNSGDTVTINGGTITAGELRNNVSMTFGGTTAGSFTAQNGLENFGDIDFLTGSKMALTISGWSASNYESEWDAGDLTIDGGNTGTFADNFQVDGSTLTVIPEPATLGMIATAGIFLMLMRRRMVK
jgi:hypothetical protein